MIRARTLSNIFKKRSLRPYYAHTQATPYAAFIDVAAVGSTAIVPGMVATKTSGDQVKIATAAGDIPFGLFGNYVNGDLDELYDSTEVSVWRGGADAVFEVTVDALDTGITWTTAAAGNPALYHNASGKLTTAELSSSQRPVARLIEAASNNKIKISLALGEINET